MKRKVSPVTAVLLALALVAWGSAPAVLLGAEETQQDAKESQPADAPEDAKETPAPKETPDDTAEETPQETAAEASEKEPPTVTASAEDFEIEISLDGNFQAQSQTELVLRPKQWTTLKVLEAVEHGTEVERGETLVRFDTEGIDKAITDHRTSLELSDLSIEQAEESLRLLETTTPMDLASARRSERIAQEDLDRFLEVDREMSKKSAENMLESARNSLEYEKEELRQLEKMYNADDLTEETEEIILKRQRDAVKRAEHYLEQAKVRYDESLTVQLPRQEESLKEDAKRREVALERAEATLPSTLSQQRIELEKMKVQRERDQQKLDELVADREAMEVKSPVDGIVYYGKWTRGKWSGSASAAEDLRRGGSISPNEVFATVVRHRPLFLSVAVPEKEVHWLHPGMSATVKPAAFPDITIRATVDQVSKVPVNNSSFEAKLTLKLGRDAEALVPGMSAKADLVVYSRNNALMVPASALSTEDLSESKVFVKVVAEDGKPKQRKVEVGRKSDGKVEIVDGLCLGEKVLKDYPRDED